LPQEKIALELLGFSRRSGLGNPTPSQELKTMALNCKNSKNQPTSFLHIKKKCIFTVHYTKMIKI
jgi:hypothetical protein